MVDDHREARMTMTDPKLVRSMATELARVIVEHVDELESVIGWVTALGEVVEEECVDINRGAFFGLIAGELELRAAGDQRVRSAAARFSSLRARAA